MPAVRLSAFESLRDAIIAQVPALDSRVFIAPHDGSQSTPFPLPLGSDPSCGGSCDGGLDASAGQVVGPSLVIERQQKFAYLPMQANREHSRPRPDLLVVEVGHHEGPVLLRLASDNEDERDELEDEILEVWLGQALRPGILVTPVTKVTRLGDFQCVWELEDGQWVAEKVLARPRASVLTLTAEIPALATRYNTPTIESLRIALTHDFDAAFDETVTTGENVEVVEIQEDGTIVSA